MINKIYLQATKNWKALIDLKETDKITRLLNNGTFTITREEYESFDKTSERIHYYFGVIDTELYIFIIDSNNDAKKDHSKVLVKRLNYGINTASLKVVKNKAKSPVKVKKFLRSVFNWNLFGYNWIENRLNNDLLFEGISNPIKDYEIMFKNTKNKETYHFLGISKKEEGINVEVNADLSKYELHLFCTYVCKRDKGREQVVQWSWPFFSNKEKNKEKKTVYSLFNGC